MDNNLAGYRKDIAIDENNLQTKSHSNCRAWTTKLFDDRTTVARDRKDSAESFRFVKSMERESVKIMRFVLKRDLFNATLSITFRVRYQFLFLVKDEGEGGGGEEKEEEKRWRTKNGKRRSLEFTRPMDFLTRKSLFRFAFYQAANLFFAAAFLVPRSFKASVLALRTFLTAGFMLAALWAGITICALDAMLWCLALGLLNGIHSLILACRFLPPALSPELAELYLKLFKPYKVSKKHFQELAKEARILKLDSGQTYATEGVTPADERLSILLRGK